MFVSILLVLYVSLESVKYSSLVDTILNGVPTLAALNFVLWLSNNLPVFAGISAIINLFCSVSIAVLTSVLVYVVVVGALLSIDDLTVLKN